MSGHLHRGWYGKVGGEEEGEGDKDEVEAGKWLSHYHFYFKGRPVAEPSLLLFQRQAFGLAIITLSRFR